MTYHAYTTLNEIREIYPYKNGWNKLLKHLGKTKADDEPLHLLTILDSNGLDDALWCLQAKSLNRLSRHFQAWCAEQVLHIFELERPDDTRVRDQIAMLRNDDATQEERKATRAASSGAASEAAWAAAWEAARSASSGAARSASSGAARAAARVSAREDVREAALEAAHAAQEAQLRAMIGATQ